MNIDNISDRSEAYNIPGLTIDGNDFLEVYNNVTKALRYARAGKGPVLIEAKTYRYSGHSQSDKQLYRDQREVQEWRKRPVVENERIPPRKSDFYRKTDPENGRRSDDLD